MKVNLEMLTHGISYRKHFIRVAELHTGGLIQMNQTMMEVQIKDSVTRIYKVSPVS